MDSTELYLMWSKYCCRDRHVICEDVRMVEQYFTNCDEPDGFAPIDLAAMRGRANLVKLMLDKGADINHCNKSSGGWTPLGHAVAATHIDVVRLLINRGANVNLGECSPINLWVHGCRRSGQSLEIFYMLWKAGANIHERFDAEDYYPGYSLVEYMDSITQFRVGAFSVDTRMALGRVVNIDLVFVMLSGCARETDPIAKLPHEIFTLIARCF